MKYRDSVLRTARLEGLSYKDRLSMGALGLAGEAGEVADYLKKHLFHDKPLDFEVAIKELGDVRWYLEYLAIQLGVTVEEIEAENIKKLQKRYPDGFTQEAAELRADELVGDLL